MVKKISEPQDIGYKGESHFCAWATEEGYFPTKIIPDHGIDFACQLRGAEIPNKKKKVWEMPGKVFLVSVRSTTESGEVVKITKDDAELLLNSSQPIILAIVRRPKKGIVAVVAIQFIDESFMRELAIFLRSANTELMDVKFNTAMTDEVKIRAGIERLFSHSYQSQMAVLRVTLKLDEVLRSPVLRVVAGAGSNIAVISCKNFTDQFDVSTDDKSFELRSALTTRGEEVLSRLQRLTLKPELLEAVNGLASKIVIGGALELISGAPECVTATRQDSKAELTFQPIATEGMLAYRHVSGLTIRFLEVPCYEKECTGHRGEVRFDQSTLMRDIITPDVLAFLDNCRDDGKLSFGGKFGVDIKDLPDLVTRSYLAHAVNVLRDSPFVSLDNWPVEDVSDEDFVSLQFLALITEQPAFLNGYGFSFIDTPFENLLQEMVKIDLPCCLNLRGKGIVCWVTGAGQIYRDPGEKLIVGLRLDARSDVRFESSDTIFPTGGFPKFKICSEWPAVPLHSKEVSFEGASDWGVGIGWDSV